MLRRHRLVASALVPVLFAVSSCSGGAPGARTVDAAPEVKSLLDTVFLRVAANDLDLPRAGRVYANVSLAMLAAVAPTDGASRALLGLVPGAPAVTAPEGLDAGIAAVAAGAGVARGLLPGRINRTALATARDLAISRLSEGRDDAVVARSVAFGVRLASAVKSRAARDGSARAASAPVDPVAGGSTVAGEWVPTPPSYSPPVEPGWGGVRRFLRVSRTCFALRPPQGADPSSPYAEEAQQVRDAVESLTEQQRLVAGFWDDTHGMTGTTAGHWVNIALAAAARKGRDLAGTVNAVAATAMASADAVAVSWKARYRSRVERPVTVIRRSVPDWQPYLVTPAVPDHPSTHTAVSRAAAEVLTGLLGESPFHDPGYGVPSRMRARQGVRKQVFESFLAAARQAGLSRVWGGVEYRMSVRAGDVLGACIGTGVVRAVADGG